MESELTSLRKSGCYKKRHLQNEHSPKPIILRSNCNTTNSILSLEFLLVIQLEYEKTST